MKEHTATPWNSQAVDALGDGIYDAEGRLLAMTQSLLDGIDNETREAERDANTAFIVRAVNSHDVLVVRIRTAITTIDHGGHLGEIRDQLMQMLKLAES